MAVKPKRKVIEGYFDNERDLRTSNKSLRVSSSYDSDSRVLYSYNTPIAVYDEDKKKYLLNKNKYSSTTSSQQNLFRAEAKSRGAEFEEVSEGQLREKIKSYDDKKGREREKNDKIYGDD